MALTSNISQQVRFCAHFLHEHGITTPEQYQTLVDSLDANDPVFQLTKVNTDDTLFENIITQLKELWPTGSREINGRRNSWQDSQKNLVIRLKQLWNAKGYDNKYSESDVLQCARQYLSDFESNAKYMLSLQHWISKEKVIKDSQGISKKIYTSKLAELLENKPSNTLDGWGDIFTDFNGMGEVI